MTTPLPVNSFVATTAAPRPNVTAAITKPASATVQSLEKSLSDLRQARTAFARDDGRILAACAVDDAITAVKRAIDLATGR